jgi:pimeloyl-ACP methyl ester carboxylesterase
MDRRDFVGAVAAATVMGTGESMAGNTGAAPPRGAGVGPEWTGARALAGGKGYAAGKLGQVHYRMTGEGGATPFLLIHQTPIGMAEYVDVQPALAALGRRSIAADNPGYGFSDPVSGSVTVADLADNLCAVCDHVGVKRVIVAGHHTGAAIAAAFAARHPQRAGGVVLHGTPLYTAEERAARLARPPANLALEADGSHFAKIFQGVGQHAGIDAQSLAGITWATIGTFLAGASSPVYKAIFGNDMEPDLRAIRAPTLVLTDRGDVLYPNDQRVLTIRPDFALHVFSDGRSFALMREPERWARVVAAFAAQHGL